MFHWLNRDRQFLLVKEKSHWSKRDRERVIFSQRESDQGQSVRNLISRRESSHGYKIQEK